MSALCLLNALVKFQYLVGTTKDVGETTMVIEFLFALTPSVLEFPGM